MNVSNNKYFQFLLKDNEFTVDCVIEKRKESNVMIPTGIKILDDSLNGGLGNGEVGIITAEVGQGKTRELINIAVNALSLNKIVLHITFEETVLCIDEKYQNLVKNTNGNLIIKAFRIGDLSIDDISEWIYDYTSVNDTKFDIIILDTLDSIDENCETMSSYDRKSILFNQLSELSAEYDVPIWTSIQAKRNYISYNK